MKLLFPNQGTFVIPQHFLDIPLNDLTIVQQEL